MVTMDFLIIIIGLIYIIYLLLEFHQNNKVRKNFTHIIHVNGTRGKSSTCRLIDAALRGGEYKVFCKTTGTSPRTIDINGIEKPIYRRAGANIKEQIKILKEAGKQGADILIIECMAVKPELQNISQNKILKADISIVTNARRDHLEEMGPTIEDVVRSLGNVMPSGGYFITGEKDFIDYYKKLGSEKDSKVYLAEAVKDYGIDFKENVAIALKVCEILGIHKDLAIERMKKHKKDPGVISTYKIETSSKNNVYFINGFSINDPDSILLIYEKLKERPIYKGKKFILLVNNRKDRGTRVFQHIKAIKKMNPEEVWITGAYQEMMRRHLIKNGMKAEGIFLMNKLDLKRIENFNKDILIFAIGNVVGHGEKIVEYINEIGELYE